MASGRWKYRNVRAAKKATITVATANRYPRVARTRGLLSQLDIDENPIPSEPVGICARDSTNSSCCPRPCQTFLDASGAGRPDSCSAILVMMMELGAKSHVLTLMKQLNSGRNLLSVASKLNKPTVLAHSNECHTMSSRGNGTLRTRVSGTHFEIVSSPPHDARIFDQQTIECVGRVE